MELNTENPDDLKYNPISSYRIQFSRSFTLNDLEKNADYLNLLGVASIYASPVFAAVPGSNHGYDATSPDMINPELGTFEDFSRLARLLREKKMGWIQDIVPNHMAYSYENPWIWDVLEKGPDSEFFGIFDFEPRVTSGRERIMLPFLGNAPEQVLENRELQLLIHRGSLALKYFDNIYPVNFKSFRFIFMPHIGKAPAPLAKIWKKFDLGKADIKGKFLNGRWEEAKKEINDLVNINESMRSYTSSILTAINDNPQLTGEIVSGQHYELCHWKETSQRINYRRFFTINDLICLRIEDKRVFEKHHRFLKELLDGGFINGLRVDHIDGLHNPGQYLRRLQTMAGGNTYISVEKILEHGENIPSSWPAEGTTGYDFLALVNNLLTPEKNYNKLQGLYRSITGEETDPSGMIYENKKFILSTNMQGELNNLSGRLENLLLYASKKGLAKYNEKKGVTPENLRKALAEFMLAFPVYRYYPQEFPLNRKSVEILDHVFKIAAERNSGIRSSLEFLKKLIFEVRPDDSRYNSLLEDFCRRLMQFTGPLTAKGLEDTSMYQYNCFVAHNEVGDHPGAKGLSVEKFHRAMIERLTLYPLAMNGTSTHDTKRGEDVRARLNVIGDLAGEWEKLVKKWIRMNEKLKSSSAKHKTAPVPNEEYLIYQTITGTFPFDEKFDHEYIKRIQDYLVKALREAKQTSSWDEPDEKHEKDVCNFAGSLLDPQNDFLSSFIPFHRKLVWRGIVNSLVQLGVKCCSPGMPDIYRGTEVWDLSLVDPDNRRPTDFGSLHENLDKSLRQWNKNSAETVRDLYKNPFDGRIKQLVTHLLLQERKTNPSLFRYGDYVPLEFSGRLKSNVFGFIRRHNDSWLMCVFPLHTGGLPSQRDGEYLSSLKWKDTVAITPAGGPENWKNILTKESLSNHEELEIGSLLGDLPVAIYKGETAPPERRSGILLHISSLPGKYGIGDFGEQAYRFVDFLSNNRQTYWQTLPLSPLTRSQSWSPYSSPSAFAGNTLFISPELLYGDGLVNFSDLEDAGFKAGSKINYGKALQFSNQVLEKAWDWFRKDTGSFLYGKYEEFCEKESYWLEDYALFLAFGEKFGNKDWGRWPSKVKNRDRKTMKTAGYEYSETIMLEKFKQFIFDRQWKKLKEYANNKGILIFGDIPYYVSYNSAEVWANQQLFKLDGKGKMITVAGVPPDYFDKNGQLWNMPVFNWTRLKETGYDWWLKRLGKNLELFDLLRLDHFRAFSAFWEVPAGDKVAVNGKWSPGPGPDFFRALELKFPGMPFVAEDLGDIDQPVYDLRDEFFLPGMQVLQFSFGGDMAKSIHTPHNHTYNSLVYTGTHDNNTLQGWYKQELGKEGKKRLSEYTGKKIRKQDIHGEIIRMAFASPARICIIPMQDYMGLDRNSRMNTPSTSRGNWVWKMKTPAIDENIGKMIREFTVMYNRR